MPRHLVVTVEICGDPVEGLWCPSCLLPSAVAMFVLIGGRSLQLLQGCRDCGMSGRCG